jgi:hypothetical protein
MKRPNDGCNNVWRGRKRTLFLFITFCPPLVHVNDMPKSGEDFPLQAKVVETRSVGEHNLFAGSGRLDSPCQDAGKCVGVEDKARQVGLVNTAHGEEAMRRNSWRMDVFAFECNDQEGYSMSALLVAELEATRNIHCV